jgi:hypothetical protein
LAFYSNQDTAGAYAKPTPAPAPAPVTTVKKKTKSYSSSSSSSNSNTQSVASSSSNSSSGSVGSYTPNKSTLRDAAYLSALYGGITYDEDAIKAKFDAATKTEYDALRSEYDATANQYYNQMYAAQNTAMDTIRKSNAAAVATGASRGIQAANELSAILGLEQTNNQTATQLATQRNDLANKEAAAYSTNAVNALTTSNTVKQALGTLAANLYASDTQFDVGEMNYYAALNQAAKALEGAKYAADSNVKAAGISAAATREAARIAANGQVEYAKYMAQNSTGNSATDYERSMDYLQSQYNTYMTQKDYNNAAIWYSKLTGLDYNKALKAVQNQNTVKKGFADISSSAANSYLPNLAPQLSTGY